MKRVNQTIEVSESVGRLIAQVGFRLFGIGARGMQLMLLTATLLMLGTSSGCVYLCNGTGDTLLFELEGDSRLVGPGECHSFPSPGGEGVKIYSADGVLLYETVAYPWQRLIFNGFSVTSSAFTSAPPDLTDTSLVFLTNDSADDVIINPLSDEAADTQVSDGWRVYSGETVEFVTVADGTRAFGAFDPQRADITEQLDSTAIDLTNHDQVVWDGVALTGKEAVTLELVNNSAADVDILWLEGKGNLDRTALGPGESMPLGVPEGEAASFQAESEGLIESSYTLDDPTEPVQILWDGEEITQVGAPGPPPPPQMATIDLHNIGTSVGPVRFVEAGKDPLTGGIIVLKFVPNSLDFPTGAPVSIQVWSGEGVTLHGECTINDPTDGDSVTWDGVVVTCEDL